ncbi:uncharacterized protein LOC111717440 [Eurytemora carolleeae]|uniref:uncharacterized protein LOC111717440 n=1 Tax=Eurytemora carolleeae TaxID=1294199 RepID=UPI000C786A21|nr:uncharacterized protein LOC111717440 [Eurytemora carolleeae]|eukprot:XP_023348711.1 uncharacterized protein LOC111717440 [Eurytemora affinis]
MNYFLSEYLGLLPFFTLAVFGEDSQLNYPTSTQVELYWRFMKQNVFYKQNVKDVKTADYFGRVQAFNRSKIREQISKEKQEKKMKKQRKQRKQQRYEDTEEDEVEEEEEAWTAKKIPAKKVKRNSHLGVTFRF